MKRVREGAAQLARALLAVSLFGVACGRSPDSPEAIAALQQAIDQRDVAETMSLLDQGVDPRAQTADGRTPLASALEAITGTTRDPTFSSKEWAVSDPGLLVMRNVMRSARRSSHTEFDHVGKLEVTLQMMESDPNKGATFVSSVTMVVDSGKKHELLMSVWETDYVNIDRQRGLSPILRPGGTYRVLGAERDAVVEVERIELTVPPDADNSIVQPVVNFLPSTFEEMKAFTWLGDRRR